MHRTVFLLVCIFMIYTHNIQSVFSENLSSNVTIKEESIGCVCGIFLSGSIKKGIKDSPKGNVTLIHEVLTEVPCSPSGNKLCITRCLNVILKNFHNSPEMICAALDRDCYREKAYLFIKNCKDKWINTNLSALQHYCCKDGLSYKCYAY